MLVVKTIVYICGPVYMFPPPSPLGRIGTTTTKPSSKLCLNFPNTIIFTNCLSALTFIYSRAHNAAVTCTLFAPVPELVFEAVERGREAAGRPREGIDQLGDKEPLTGYAVISGDYDGDIKVFIKEGKVIFKLFLGRHFVCFLLS